MTRVGARESTSVRAKTVKASTRLAREIVETMYVNGMGPGDHYLSESDALKRHGVGRGTYREALRFLESLGIVTIRSGPGGGAVISEPNSGEVASTVALWLQFSRAPLRTVLEARHAIEPGIAQLASLNATDEEIVAMELDLLEAEAEIGNFRTFLPAYLRFWRHLAESTHNPLLALLSPALRTIVNSAGFVPDEPYRVQILGYLRNVHGAVGRRDPDAAAVAMRDLEAEFNRRLAEGYPRQLERVVAWSALEAPDPDEG